MTEAARGPSWVGPVAGWAFSGLVVGTAVGTLLQILGKADAIAAIAATGAAVGAVLGGAVGIVEVRRSASRPVLADGAGRPVRRASAGVVLVPLGAAGAGFVALAVLATVQQASPVVGAGFLLAGVGCGAVARSVWTHGLLARAAEDAARGDRERAIRAWRRLATGWWVPRTGRHHAALNLGLASAIDGDLDGALRWYARVTRGRAAAFARVGVALVRTLQGAWPEAEAALAVAAGGGRALQPEVDGVRLLLVLRRDGPEAARVLGERLLCPESGSLFLGVLAAARQRAGDPGGAEALVAAGLGEALRRSGLVRLLPELAEPSEHPDG